MDANAFVERYKIRGLYHFTSSQNIPSIERNGLLSRRAQRESGVICPEPGGDDLSLELDDEQGLDAYVHLCLRPNHPMVYVQQRRGRLKEVSWLRVNPGVLTLEGVRYYPDNSMKAGVEPVALPELCERVDFELLVKRTDWSDPAIQERLSQVERVEILVPTRVTAVEGIIG